MATTSNKRLQHLIVPASGRHAASFIEAKPSEGPPRLAPERIETRRLILRPLVTEDRPAFVGVLESAREEFENAVPLALPNQSASDAFERQLELMREGDRRCVAWRRVAVTPDGRLIGGVAIRQIERGLTHRGEAIWWIARDARRQGFGVEMVGAAIKAGFADLPEGLGLATITAMIQPANAPSQRLARAIGFQRAPSGDADVEVAGSTCPHEAWTLSAARVIAV